ncbi:hypothetical protein EGW08_013761 [Elysia chlorotica]|uniref:Uncharacterized protein n=1 Tax=Elysia chlorotica TaxID=188477 RepID=A0A3S1BDT5_ELYCH|nr:hypothetical protein EGW08_013761 [Elysia chlorotica]
MRPSTQIEENPAQCKQQAFNLVGASGSNADRGNEEKSQTPPSFLPRDNYAVALRSRQINDLSPVNAVCEKNPTVNEHREIIGDSSRDFSSRDSQDHLISQASLVTEDKERTVRGGSGYSEKARCEESNFLISSPRSEKEGNVFETEVSCTIIKQDDKAIDIRRNGCEGIPAHIDIESEIYCTRDESTYETDSTGSESGSETSLVEHVTDWSEQTAPRIPGVSGTDPLGAKTEGASLMQNNSYVNVHFTSPNTPNRFYETIEIATEEVGIITDTQKRTDKLGFRNSLGKEFVTMSKSEEVPIEHNNSKSRQFDRSNFDYSVSIKGVKNCDAHTKENDVSLSILQKTTFSTQNEDLNAIQKVNEDVELERLGLSKDELLKGENRNPCSFYPNSNFREPNSKGNSIKNKIGIAKFGSNVVVTSAKQSEHDGEHQVLQFNESIGDEDTAVIKDILKERKLKFISGNVERHNIDKAVCIRGLCTRPEAQCVGPPSRNKAGQAPGSVRGQNLAQSPSTAWKRLVESNIDSMLPAQRGTRCPAQDTVTLGYLSTSRATNSTSQPTGLIQPSDSNLNEELESFPGVSYNFVQTPKESFSDKDMNDSTPSMKICAARIDKMGTNHKDKNSTDGKNSDDSHVKPRSYIEKSLVWNNGDSDQDICSLISELENELKNSPLSPVSDTKPEYCETNGPLEFAQTSDSESKMFNQSPELEHAALPTVYSADRNTDPHAISLSLPDVNINHTGTDDIVQYHEITGNLSSEISSSIACAGHKIQEELVVGNAVSEFAMPTSISSKIPASESRPQLNVSKTLKPSANPDGREYSPRVTGYIKATDVATATDAMAATEATEATEAH